MRGGGARQRDWAVRQWGMQGEGSAVGQAWGGSGAWRGHWLVDVGRRGNIRVSEGVSACRKAIDRHWGQRMARLGASALRGAGRTTLGACRRRPIRGGMFPSCGKNA